MPVSGNSSVCNVVEPHQQVYERGFAAARRSDYRGLLPGFYVYVEIFDEFFVGNVREINIFSFDASFCIGKLDSVFRVGDL